MLGLFWTVGGELFLEFVAAHVARFAGTRPGERLTFLCFAKEK